MSVVHDYYLEHFKEMYYNEHEQKEKINGRIQTPIGFLSLLIALDAFYINGIEDIQKGTWGVVFYVMLSLLSLSLIVVIFYLMKAYYTYSYKYIPTPTVLENKANEHVVHFDTYYEQYRNYYNLPKEECVKNQIDKDMYHYYKTSTEENMILNERKLKYLRNIGYLLIISLILGLTTLFPYFMAHEKSDIQKIEIEKISELIDTIQFKKIDLNDHNDLVKTVQEQEKVIREIKSELEAIQLSKVNSSQGGE
ncbi:MULTISPECIES: hypothetical protein [Paenibacillus]|uniref:SMODS and SLOG-associating 2TM effector domain-containing protein n=1 Tax=Paenibacillus odorifer TaxID=189426 RepID=A0ABX3HVC4_9BACL|nr:hypothetical protein [Paenibacillus odorifer]OMD55312.1 hypothetical protein BSK51_04465 [Paenibacillus odorifer]